jgi:hypothetical protein
METKVKKRVYILVKAYPQPSQQYEETVCCAGVTEEGEFLRLYPIRYRRLMPEQKFDRYDLCEMSIWRDKKDYRPESHKVDADSIRIVKKGNLLKYDQKPKLWLPFVTDSLAKLKQDNVEIERSLGIIKPDKQGIKFFWHTANGESEEDKSLRQQASLFDSEPLTPLKVEYNFGYKFTSGGFSHEMKIHDWEVQATYFNYKRHYGSEVLPRMEKEFGERFLSRNLHFVMGTMKAHHRQFIIVGLLRTSVNLEQLAAQSDMFG